VSRSLKFGDLSVERFFAEYWRKKPIFLKGAARDILGFEVSASMFRDICHRLEREAPQWIERVGDGTVFAQNMDTVSAELEAASRDFAAMTSCRRVWFDGVHAVDGSGIGCHYDHSDNFVLQQSGRKVWRLHSPAHFPQDELRDRMLDRPEAGMSHMPDDAFEYVLDAGDVLYIPLFWAHWGVSVGPSLSTSIVYNADNALDVLLPELRKALSDDPTWWRPMPVRPTSQQEIDAFLVRLVDSLGSDDVRSRLVQRFGDVGYEGAVTSTLSEEPAPSLYGRGAKRKKKILFNLDLIEAVVSAPVDKPAPERLLTATIAPEDGESLLAHRAQDSLRDLGTIASESSSFLERAGILHEVRYLLGRLGRLDSDDLIEVAARPEVASWLWRASEAIESCYLHRIKQVFAHLPGVLLPMLAWADVAGVGPSFRVPTSDGGVNLLGVGKRLVLPEADGWVDVTPLTTGLLFDLGERGHVEVPRDALDPENAETIELERGRLVQLDAVASGVTLVGFDAWCSGFFPEGQRFASAGCGAEGAAWRGIVNQACGALSERWPGITDQIELVMPRSSAAAEYHGTAPDFPGLLLVGDEAPAGLLADLGHDRFNGLLATEPLLTNLEYERCESALFEEPRAYVDILRAAFGRVVAANLEPERLEGVDSALDAVSDGADLTDAGEAMVAALRTALQKA